MSLLAAFLTITFSQQKTPAWTEQVLRGGVKISSPKKLLKKDQKVDDPGLANTEYWAALLDDCVLVVGISDVKAPDKTSTSELFSGAVAGSAAAKDSAIIGEKDLLLQGWPGIAVTVRDADGSVSASRIYRVGNLFVQLAAFYDAGEKRPASADQFLASLKFASDGEQKTAGPVLTRFPLGDSGMSALFPRAPEKTQKDIGKGAAKGPMYVFSSDHAVRSLQVAYRDLPVTTQPTDEEADAARVAIAEEVVASFHGKKTSQKDETVGSDQGLRVNFDVMKVATGTILVYLHGTRVVTLVEIGPKAYVDDATVDTFMHSVQFDPKN